MGISKLEFEQMQDRLGKKPELKESELHAKIRDYCKAQWPRWKVLEARMDKRSTIPIGCHDFTIFMPNGKILYVECKRKGQKLDKDQLAWQAELAMLGHTVHVAHDMNEFIIASVFG